ncbi:ferrichrome ABC transporter substrate-binding protein [Paenibacillus marchantiophytorum]|uniref:Ferrichrome ABC transporter substrate-binding protein n=1 Tax=Paenibacillus marchantiophytorum TaxID=1619310 RepID=A0ABQ1F0W8_9BACL|nr:iron-siderophore ABC transporter substrate-binding protein [Paenibacillus marchantiophytorum]GFZ94827.1 ferrichrome ABC transporter substrate-binding protein [Paenibacillus marchantiophytorum]
MSQRLKPLVVLLAVLLLIAGCGAKSVTNSGASPSASPEAASANAERVIKHVRGEAKIKGTPKRIVALEWKYVEELLALGIQPVGVADIAGYKKWISAKPELAANVQDVGTRQEPSLELITSLKPDLIIAAGNRVKNNYEQLSAIAPTLVFDQYLEDTSKNQYAEMESHFKVIADIVGKKTEADVVLADLNKSYEAAKTKLQAAGKAGTDYVLVSASSNQNAVSLRLFLDNSAAIEVLNRIGLKNAYKSQKYETNGFSTASVESLLPVQQANLLYVVQPDDNVFAKQLKDNDVWKSLTFVKESRLYPLGGDMWLYGGPGSLKLLVEKTVEQLTKK